MAAAATAVAVLVYTGIVLVLNVTFAHRLLGGVDARLAERLADVGRLELGSGALPGDVRDHDEAPVFVWRTGVTGATSSASSGAPPLPGRAWSPGPVSLDVAGVPFRFDAAPSPSGWVVVGTSIAQIARVPADLVEPEVLVGALLAAAIYAGALVVGLRASAPLEEATRRQTEFTADASHELRTPLSVIEAEVALALSRPRRVAEYRETLERVAAEGRRLRGIVDDLLWLARADAEPAGSPLEPVDLAATAAACAARFAAVAEARGVALRVEPPTGEPVLVTATPALLERLVGVLVDNACRHAGSEGTVRVLVESAGGRAVLRVEDSGPGIPPAERARIFDRFHRATDAPGGTGLGLAIADSVVRTTGGTWSIGHAPLGGASMEVSWRRVPGGARASRRRSGGSAAAVPAPPTATGASLGG
ncbi:MAG TPA: HAMP domain-containing sensor histidine kinase [Acidimicrobiales bacterium]|nr:HAMP domain-containing sensor histidine kinase [Acidimicrobiales bacterium]